MPKKNKILLIIISEFAFLFFILIVLPTLFIQERPGIFQNNHNDNLSLDIKNDYIQEFVADQNNLEAVSVLFKNPALLNKSQVNISILDNKKSVLRSLTTSGVSIGDPAWITFKFPYIPSRKDDVFYIKVTSDNNEPNNLFVIGDSTNKTINFKTFYAASNFKESFKNTLTEQSNRFNQRNIVSNTSLILIFILLNIILFFSL